MTTNIVEISSLASAISLASHNDFFIGYRYASGVGATNITYKFPVRLLPLSFNGRVGKVVPATNDYSAAQISETTGYKILTNAERVKLTGLSTAVGGTGQLDIGTATGYKLWNPLVLSSFVNYKVNQIVTSGLASAIENTIYFASETFTVTSSASGTYFNVSLNFGTTASMVAARGNHSHQGLFPLTGTVSYYLKKTGTGATDIAWAVLTASGVGDGVGYDTIQLGTGALTKQGIFRLPTGYFTASNHAGGARTDIGFLASVFSLASHTHTTVYAAYSHNHNSLYQGKSINVTFAWSGKPVAGSVRSVVNTATSNISFGTGQSAINLKALATVAPAVTRSFRLRTSSDGSTWSNKQLINMISGQTTGSIVSGGTTGFTWIQGYILQLRGPTASDANMAGVVMGIRGTQA